MGVQIGCTEGGTYNRREVEGELPLHGGHGLPLGTRCVYASSLQIEGVESGICGTADGWASKLGRKLKV